MGRSESFKNVALTLLMLTATGVAAAQQSAQALFAAAHAADAATQVTQARTNATAILHQEPLALKVAEFSQEALANAKAQPKVKKAAIQKAVNVADLAGTWVQSFTSLSNYTTSGGCQVTISPVEGAPDSIAITNFWTNMISPAVVVKAHVDPTTGRVTIPNQKVVKDADMGWLDLAYATASGPVRNKPLEGQVNADGSITIDSWWAIYVVEGDYADKFVASGHQLQFDRKNGTMSFTDAKGNKLQYAVHIDQPLNNVINVKNFYNSGFPLEITLNGDRTGTILTQTIRQELYNNTITNYNIIKCLTFTETGALATYANMFNTDAATDNRHIRWTDWSALCLDRNPPSYAGRLTDACITADFDISYPELGASDFTGAGTEADPYLITNMSDLMLLAAKVNDAPVSEGSKYASVFAGKYFRMENDIDLSNTRFTPIGQDIQHRFAGTFDGNGHKINNLNIDLRWDYAALFGNADSTSVIKNLTMVNPKVTTTGSMCASVAGYSYGTLTNCHVINPQITGYNLATAGLAGIANVIDNCSVTGGTVMSYGSYAGGLVGEVSSEIANSHVSEITIMCSANASNSPTGGLAANLYMAKARNCYAAATIDGSLDYSVQNVGGIAGNCTFGSIENCFFVGQLMAYHQNSMVGGITGQLMGKLSNSYSAGRIDSPASTKCGGLTGYVRQQKQSETAPALQSEVSNCYTSAFVNAQVGTYDAQNGVRESLGEIEANTTPVLTNVYFNRQITDYRSARFGSTTAELTAAAGPAGFDASVWTFTEGYYPRLTTIADNQVAQFSASLLYMDPYSSLRMLQHDAKLDLMGNTTAALYINGSFSNKGHYSTIENGTLKIGNEIGCDTLFLMNGDNLYYLEVNVTPSAFQGEGTKDNPYLIQNKYNLISLSQITTNEKQAYADTYFLMTNDIDLEYSDQFTGLSADAGYENMFKGTFDGGGHTIHRMKINAVSWSKEPTDSTPGTLNTANNACRMYNGFISKLDASGVVRNLNIAADCDLQMFSNAGAIVGRNYGLVENCRNYAEVTGYSQNVGGIVGCSESKSVITNCFNAGNVYGGSSNVGGIAGRSLGTIENCVNTGDAILDILTTNFKTNLNFAGGIAGGTSGATLNNVANFGNVKATTSKAGGIAGSMPKATTQVTNTMNFGLVASGDATLLGAIGGESGTGGSIENNVWDNQIIPLKANGNAECAGMTGLGTAELTAGTTIGTFDAALWQFEAGMYPVLKQFADEPTVAAARRMIVTMPAGTNAYDLKANATLAQAEGLKWSLANGSVFKIEGNTLTAPASVDALVVDTLTAEMGGLIKPIVLKSMPANPLKGAGTEADPFIIATAADWNGLASYMAVTGDDLNGMFVKLTADIDFTGIDFKPIAYDGITYLQGSIDGAGHTVSGISYTTVNSYEGALGTIGENAKVANLTLAGDITSTKSYTAGFAGRVYGSIENCVNQINVTSTQTYTAGFAGIAYTGARFVNCVNKAKIASKQINIAGIAAQANIDTYFEGCGNEGVIRNDAKANYTAGIAANVKPSTFIGCYNTGRIELSDAKNTIYVGGIIALADGQANSRAYIISKCYNEADIACKTQAAGIIASAGTTAGNVKLQMDSCYNTGDITSLHTATVSSSAVAGIIANFAPASTISNCWNTGTITTNKCQNAAGIAGVQKTAPTAAYPLTIVNCHNSGTIIALNGSAGGIMGTHSAYTTVDNCWNTGEIEGTSFLGGISGQMSGANAKIINSWNSGNVTASQNRAGGLFGFCSNATATVENSWNSGSVTSTSDKGGVALTSTGCAVGGLAGATNITFRNCWNTGTVSGISQVGGLVGQPTKEKTAFYNCYNAGQIVADADTCGAIVGAISGKNGTTVTVYWNEKNVAENTYFVKELVKSNHADVGTAVNMEGLTQLNMGNNWTSMGDYTMPVTSNFTNCDAAQVNAAAVVLATGDTYDSVTKDFKVGVPTGVTWSATAAVTFDGNDAKVSKYDGEVTLTASKGDFSKEVTLYINAITTGIDSIGADNEVVDQAYYTIDGLKVARPEAADGRVYVVIATYADGTVRSFKVVNK